MIVKNVLHYGYKCKYYFEDVNPGMLHLTIRYDNIEHKIGEHYLYIQLEESVQGCDNLVSLDVLDNGYIYDISLINFCSLSDFIDENIKNTSEEYGLPIFDNKKVYELESFFQDEIEDQLYMKGNMALKMSSTSLFIQFFSLQANIKYKVNEDIYFYVDINNQLFAIEIKHLSGDAWNDFREKFSNNQI